MSTPFGFDSFVRCRVLCGFSGSIYCVRDGFGGLDACGGEGRANDAHGGGFAGSGAFGEEREAECASSGGGSGSEGRRSRGGGPILDSRFRACEEIGQLSLWRLRRQESGAVHGNNTVTTLRHSRESGNLLRRFHTENQADIVNGRLRIPAFERVKKSGGSHRDGRIAEVSAL